jgi:hypothetical protein
MFDVCGLASVLALDDDFVRKQLDVFERVYNSVTDLSTENEKRLPCTVLSCFFADMDALEKFHIRTKFSNAERTLSEFLVENRENAEKNADNLHYFKVLYANTSFEAGRELFFLINLTYILATSEAPVKRCCFELLKYVNAPETLAKFREWTNDVPKFSITGYDLMNAGVPKGPSMSDSLSRLHQLWVEVCYNIRHIFNFYLE